VTTAEKYVAAAYGVFVLAVLVYVVIIALKLERLDRELDDLLLRLRKRRAPEVERREEVGVG
jgi:hypothetical protein